MVALGAGGWMDSRFRGNDKLKGSDFILDAQQRRGRTALARNRGLEAGPAFLSSLMLAKKS